MDFGDGDTIELTQEQCWELLRSEEFGRLAFRLLDEVHLVPINYAVDRDTLLFSTEEGNKLLGIVMCPEVVFEIDSFDEHQAHSVILRGTARLLDEHEAHRAENVPLRPWVEHTEYNVVEIRPTQLTGHAFRLHRPWLHARPTA
jgi:nitroimidazol reductase NimA-like FMN-containing flavoprotein (pyridoxamine 5'-phosphate oxidase superfamily)